MEEYDGLHYLGGPTIGLTSNVIGWGLLSNARKLGMGMQMLVKFRVSWSLLKLE